MFSHSADLQVDVSSLTLDRLWHTAVSGGFPVALWRLPNQTESHLIVQFSEKIARHPADLDELPPGFAIAGFADMAGADGEPFMIPFLRADAHFVLGETGTVREETSPAYSESVALFYENLARPEPDISPVAWPTAQEKPNPEDQLRYETAVAEAVRQMHRGGLRKVVLSRTKRVEFTAEPDAVALFDRLSAAYSSAFVSAVFLPERGQTWVCATPERLVSQDISGTFRTVSLAGTQSALWPDGSSKRPVEAVWTHKEIEEQALVSRYIIECFKKIRLREYVESGPKTVVAGNLMHLRTDFSVDTQATNFSQLGTVMLRLLHPTSAVGGMPRPAALSFIEVHETHNRELYAGFVGPVNMGGASDLFVHLRCLKLEGAVATLYAGAGLTEDSDPAREWRETELKCRTLLNVMEEGGN
jgi:isochorismate synthase